ncbi:FlgD immunoglobulin-like domain containing protein [Candidatus Latescibacterota bacterium]
MNHIWKTLILTFFMIIRLSIVWAGEAEITSTLSMKTGLGATDLSDIAWDGSSLWVSGSGTLSYKLWGDGHSSTDWISYRSMPGFGRGSMTALYASDQILMVAWRYSDERGDEIVSMGDGFSISFDSGQTWSHITIDYLVQQVFPERSELKYPGTYTMSYDIKFSDGTLWCPTTSGFLLKTDNFGYTWESILPNTDEFNFQNPNHHGQCVEVYGDTLWVGTFQGMNASFDRGDTWTNFSWPFDNTDNNGAQWPGNFCVAVEHKIVGGKTNVWVGSQPYFGKGVSGICHTDDNGQTWTYKSTKYNAWNFAFGYENEINSAVSDSTIFAASDSGLVVSYDLGDNWEVLTVKESDNLFWEPGMQIFGVLVAADTLWVTSTDGIASSPDWGQTWNIFRGVTRVKTLDTSDRNIGISSQFDDVETYAFPNPFTPTRGGQAYSRTRIHYALKNDASVSVYIYDFSGKLVKEIFSGKFRVGGRDYQEIWDGRDGDNVIVPNGVYYYLIKTNKGDSARGKVIVLD